VARSAAAAADAPATTSETELTVEALSVRDIVPVQQQQQQQQEGVDEELPAELRDVADVLRGAVAWREEQERMAGILEKLGKALLSISSAGLGVSVWGLVSLDV
jgi:ribosomal protein S7